MDEIRIKNEPIDEYFEVREFDTGDGVPYEETAETQMTLQQKVQALTQRQHRIEDKLNTVLENQTVMMRALSKMQTALIGFRQSTDSVPQTVVFPLNSDEDLMRINDEISKFPDKYLGLVKGLIWPEGLCKSFARIFSQRIILTYNYDGLTNKKNFKQYSALNRLLFEALKKEGLTEKEYVEEVRKAFKMHKSKHYKKVCLARKANEREHDLSVHFVNTDESETNYVLLDGKNENGTSDAGSGLDMHETESESESVKVFNELRGDKACSPTHNGGYERVTPEQNVYFRNFCVLHPEITELKGSEYHKDLWLELTKGLNSLIGPKRSMKFWRGSFEKKIRRQREIEVEPITVQPKFTDTFTTGLFETME